MKPIAAADLSAGVLAISDDLAVKLTRALSRAVSAKVKEITRDLKAGLFEEAKADARELEFKSVLAKNVKAIRRFTQSAALIGSGAVDSPKTSVFTQAGSMGSGRGRGASLQNTIAKLLEGETRRRVQALIDRAARFQKASDPIDPDKLAKDLNRYLRGEIRRVVDVSANIVGTRVSAYGMLYEARARGISRYRIDAVVDDRTTEICRHMDGRTFEVEQAYVKTGVLLAETDPDKQKQLAPFPSLDDVRGKTNQEVQFAGHSVPPFHFLCRSVVTLVSAETTYDPIQYSKFPDEAPAYEADTIDRIFRELAPITRAAIKVDTDADLIKAKVAADDAFELPAGFGTAARAYALNAYTGNYFNSINDTLRRHGTWSSTEAREIARTIDKVAADVPPLTDDLVVYRGAAGVVLDQLDDIGKAIQDDGFVSTSVTPGTAMQFGRKDAVLQILVPKGSQAIPMGDLSLTKYEGEVILPRGSQFRVVGISTIALPDSEVPLKVIRVVYQGQGRTFDLDAVPDLETWIAEQESVVKDQRAERGRAKFYYTKAGDIFPVTYG